MSVRDSGLSLVGTVLGADGGVPLRIEYRVLTDAAGLTTAANVREQRGFGQHALTLVRDVEGGWTGDGCDSAPCRGCTDVDLGVSPSTHTLPIRRLRLPVGDRRRQRREIRFLGLESRRWRGRTRGWTSSHIVMRAVRSGRADRRRQRARHRLRGVAPTGRP